jgi:predicted ribosome quality control (RQC) complex YloA/Tae2 family protein
VTLNDFQTGKPLEIKLKKDLSAQKNAELYYRKAKKEKIEFEVLEKNLKSKEQEIETLKTQIETIEKTDSLKSLRSLFKKDEITPKKSKILKAEDLFKVFEIEGYKIWIGKNAKNNDLLTLKYSHKNDTWLHAKDVSGSHVVIKEISGQKTPKRVLETAAGLAAWFSKKRNDTMVPVAYTPKKFVRKIKGTPDGAVMVEKEDVLLIEPIDPASLVEH